MNKFLLTIIFLLAFALTAQAQNCQTVEECNQELDLATRQINKLLDVTEAQEKAIEALKTEIAARERLSAIDAEIIKRKDNVIGQQQKLIGILEKESRRKISFFFGLVKITY